MALYNLSAFGVVLSSALNFANDGHTCDILIKHGFTGTYAAVRFVLEALKGIMFCWYAWLQGDYIMFAIGFTAILLYTLYTGIYYLFAKERHGFGFALSLAAVMLIGSTGLAYYVVESEEEEVVIAGISVAMTTMAGQSVPLYMFLRNAWKYNWCVIETVPLLLSIFTTFNWMWFGAMREDSFIVFSCVAGLAYLTVVVSETGLTLITGKGNIHSQLKNDTKKIWQFLTKRMGLKK